MLIWYLLSWELSKISSHLNPTTTHSKVFIISWNFPGLWPYGHPPSSLDLEHKAQKVLGPSEGPSNLCSFIHVFIHPLNNNTLKALEVSCSLLDFPSGHGLFPMNLPLTPSSKHSSYGLLREAWAAIFCSEGNLSNSWLFLFLCISNLPCMKLQKWYLKWQLFPLSNAQECHNPHPDSTISLLRGSDARLVLGNTATFFISLNLRKQTRFPTFVGRVGRDKWYGQCRAPIVSQRHSEAAFLTMTHVLVRMGHCQKIQGRFWVTPSFKILSPRLQGTH